MTGHEHPKDLVLLAFGDGELPEAEAQAVAEHCTICAECSRLLTDFEAVRVSLAADLQLAGPQPVWPLVASRLQHERSRRIGPMFALGTTAACAAGIVLGLMLGTPPSQSSTENDSVAWTSVDQIRSGSGSASLLDVFYQTPSQEESEGS